jgi:hypothetical protein
LVDDRVERLLFPMVNCKRLALNVGTLLRAIYLVFLIIY